MFAAFLDSAFCCFSTHDNHHHNCNKMRYTRQIHSMAFPTQQRVEKEKNTFFIVEKMVKKMEPHISWQLSVNKFIFFSKEITATCLFYRSCRNGMSDWITFRYFLKYLIDHMINSVSNNFTIKQLKNRSLEFGSSNLRIRQFQFITSVPSLQTLIG